MSILSWKFDLPKLVFGTRLQAWLVISNVKKQYYIMSNGKETNTKTRRQENRGKEWKKKRPKKRLRANLGDYNLNNYSNIGKYWAYMTCDSTRPSPLARVTRVQSIDFMTRLRTCVVNDCQVLILIHRSLIERNKEEIQKRDWEQ